jgi:hypothetical protein
MNIQQAIKRGLRIRKQERFYAIDQNGLWWELPTEARLLYGVIWKPMPKKKRNRKRG